MKALIGLRNGLIISLVLGVLIFLAVKCFAEETVLKVDDYSAKITISNITEKDGVKTTLSQERVFTLTELNTAKSMSENALKSWQDAKVKADENIVIQTNQIALWQSLIDECILQGIIEKPEPIEQPIEQPIEK